MAETREWTVSELWSEFWAERPDYQWGVPDAECIDGFRDDPLWHGGKWGRNYLVVFEREGGLWAFEYEVFEKAGTSLDDYGRDDTITCRAVEEIVSTSYRYVGEETDEDEEDDDE